jgi:hypothetical protein
LTLVTSPASPRTASTHWRQADSEVLVATIDGEYGGFIVLGSEGVDAHGPLGENLGRHASADLAKATVEEARETSTSRAVSRSRGPFRLTRPLRTRRRGTHGR